jgi:PhnB protein
MAKVSTYLNFSNNTEEVFNFYKRIFQTEFERGIMRYGDVPSHEGMPPMNEEHKNLVMHVALPITGGHYLMGSDTLPMNAPVNKGNNMYICLHPDSRTEADRLFKALSEGGKVEMAPAEQFWGDYFGSWTDKYGIYWMVNTDAKQ